MAKRQADVSPIIVTTEPAPSPLRPLHRASTADILAADLPPLAWVVPDCLANELTVLAGSRNSGTAWLALDWAIAVATGSRAMGEISCEAGDVLYVDLESGARHIRSSLAALLPDRAAEPALTRLAWMTEAPSLADDGFIGALDDWRAAADAPRLVVVDGAQSERVSRTPSQADYDGDHAAMVRLRRWSNAHGVAVLFLCRLRSAADPLGAPHDASGILAAADTTLWLERRASAAKLHVRRRSARDRQWELELEGVVWSLVGDAADCNRSDQRVSIMEALAARGTAITPMEIADETDIPVGNVRKLIARMVEAGEVRKHSYGHYTLPYE